MSILGSVRFCLNHRNRLNNWLNCQMNGQVKHDSKRSPFLMPGRRSRMLSRVAGAVFSLALLAVAEPGRSESAGVTADSREALPAPISYTTFDRVELSLHPYRGRHLMWLLPSGNWEKTRIQALMDVVDRAYDFYAQAVGGQPIPHPPTMREALGTIAIVPKTCGGGCGYISRTGIEIKAPYFQALYDNYQKTGEFETLPIYELGRNFWLPSYAKKLEYQAPDASATVRTGFAAFMRLEALDVLQIQPGSVYGTPFEIYRQDLRSLLWRYQTDRTMNWQNTLRSNQAPQNSLCSERGICIGAPELWAAMLLEIRDRYSPNDPTFAQRLWAAVRDRPDATSTETAVDNWIISLCETTQRNLVWLFEDVWRWPVSDRAKRAVRHLPSGF